MKKLVLAAALATLFTGTAQADAIGLYVGGQVWDSEASGLVGEVDNMIDFNLEKEQQGSYFIAFEHPLPFIPNVRLSSTTLDTTGKTALTDEFEFDDETFAAGTTIDTGFNVSYVDYTLYYELFSNDLFAFDFGLTARDFDGDVTVSAQINTAALGDTPVYVTTTGSIDTDEYIPMLYASTQIGLPFTGLNIFAQGNFLSIDDHTLLDYQAGVSYELIDNLAIDINLTLGYRSVKMELEDLSDLYSDIEFKGVFAGAVIHF